MELVPEFLTLVSAFEWDEGKSTRNWHRHGVLQAE
jgi:uncharacterized DUF497 family protein